MRIKLLEILAEPGTGAALRLEATRRTDDRVEEGTLVSEATGKRYPIVRGIPRFVEDDGYTASFGMQWNMFRETQVDSATGASRSEDRFQDETGWSKEQLTGKWLLDAGCGAGRFAEIACARGADVVALDYSSAVEAAAGTLARFPNVDVVQGSVLAPPFRKAGFDFAYCIGVAQHTPDPQLAVRSVVEAVKPGGRFAFSIYARRPWTKLNTKYLIRPLTRKLPKKVLLGAIKATMPVLFPVTDTLFRVPVVGRIAKFAIPVASYPEHPGFTREQRYEESVLDTFDMLSPEFDSPMTWQEVESVLRDVRCARWSFKTRVPINVEGGR